MEDEEWLQQRLVSLKKNQFWEKRRGEYRYFDSTARQYTNGILNFRKTTLFRKMFATASNHMAQDVTQAGGKYAYSCIAFAPKQSEGTRPSLSLSPQRERRSNLSFSFSAFSRLFFFSPFNHLLVPLCAGLGCVQ